MPFKPRLRRTSIGIVAVASMLLPLGAATTAAVADESKAVQTLNVDYGTETGDFYGGASGMLYGVGDDGSPTDAIVDGARVYVTSQKPPSGLQHPSADVLAVENQFFSNGGEELVVNLQDWYPDWPYTSGKRPGDTRTYKLDGDVNASDYGTYTETGNGTWDFDEVLEVVMNKILANAEHPDKIVFMPFNEPDHANWYGYGNNTGAKNYAQFLKDWNEAYGVIQKVWNQYKNGEKTNANGVKPTADHALIAGPGDSSWRPNTTKKLLETGKANNTLPDVVVWHELGSGSIGSYPGHYKQYRSFEKELGISPRAINISEFGQMRDMSVPGQIIQWLSLFEETKVQVQTAYWNYAGNLNDNMSRANGANGAWWMYKWYGDLRGTTTVKVTSEHPNTTDNLQGVAAIDKQDKKATVLYGGANDQIDDATSWGTGANTPVKVHVTGLDSQIFGTKVDVQVRESAYVGTEGVAAAPRVVNVMSNVDVVNGTLDVTTNSVDRYAGYQLVITPHQDTQTAVDDANDGRSLQVVETEDTKLEGKACKVTKDANTGSNTKLMFSGNGDVGCFNSGAKMTWDVDVPADGDYRLQLITAPAGVPGTNGVSVDGKEVGSLEIGAELALRDQVKWKYRGSAEIVLKGLTKGKHSITISSTDLDNETDKILLYQVSDGKTGPVDQVTYPASDMRLENGTTLTWDGNGNNGFANLNGGTVDVFAHAWEAGYQDVTVAYNASMGAQIALSINGQAARTITAPRNGLQTSTVRVAMSEGINRLELSGAAGILLKNVTTARAGDGDANAVKVEAEDSSRVTLNGGAAVETPSTYTNASGKSFVKGLGSQFETEESGKAGFGDRTRVVADANHVPTVHEDNKGTMTIKGVPAGTYNMVVHFSNEAFIGKHDYNPQVVDLGLQVRQNNVEIARGSFRYTYTETNFLNRSINVTTDGGDLTLGNWDKVGDLKAAVSWGVAPNVDSVTFYPVTIGDQIDDGGVDTSALEEAVSKANQLVQNDYTAESWNVLQTALAEANSALDSTDQSAVDAAAQKLNEAIKALVKAGSSENNGQNGGSQNGNSQNGNNQNGGNTGAKDDSKSDDAGDNQNAGSNPLGRTGVAVIGVFAVAAVLIASGVLLTRMRKRNA